MALPMHTPHHKFDVRDIVDPFDTKPIPITVEVPQSQFPIEPYEDVVFVEQDENNKHASGLILAGVPKLPAGRVVAVGPGRYFHPPMDASGFNSGAVFVPTKTKVGDYVVFGRYQSGGEPLEIEGKKYLLCREGDLAGRSRSGDPVDVRVVKE